MAEWQNILYTCSVIIGQKFCKYEHSEKLLHYDNVLLYIAETLTCKNIKAKLLVFVKQNFDIIS